MEEPLQKTLADFFTLSHKIHSFHTDCRGQGFIYYHPFLGEVYSYLISKIDEIKEYLRQNQYYPQCDSEELYKMAITDGIEPLTENIVDIRIIQPIVSKDLGIILTFLDQYIQKLKIEPTTQNLLIDYKLAISKFKRINDSEQGI